MTNSLEDYRKVTPPGSVDLLYHMSEKVKGKSLLNINSTRSGGGVAEILNRLVPMLNELEIKVGWEIMQGSEGFFKVTKAFHNALQGRDPGISDRMYQLYIEENRENAKRLTFDADMILVHDLQPAALIDYADRAGKWVWRCHIDISHPARRVWRFLKNYVLKYDAAIFSLPTFAQKLPIPKFLIYPSIDPLSDKNRDLSRREVNKILDRLDIPRDKPILLQVSRFDRFKDPVGVIQAYRIVKKYNDCRLILVGGGAADDPEGDMVLQEVREAAGQDPDIHVLLLPPDSNIEVNALQRAATVVLQKSLREGFGLTVAEAMWKGKPVVGGFAGGITVQIMYYHTGYTVSSVEGAAFRVRHLLNNPEIGRKMGNDAKEYVRRNFLITRHLADYLTLMAALTNGR
ncbi:MAG: glycosyltransferase [candidate division NC10 bacterium]|nr:glycosyltransferase [candidate division NC10 bacterium]